MSRACASSPWGRIIVRADRPTMKHSLRSEAGHQRLSPPLFRSSTLGERARLLTENEAGSNPAAGANHAPFV